MKNEVCQSDEVEGGRDAPIISVRDVHDLIDWKVRVFFRKEGPIGKGQIEKGNFSGIISAASQDGDHRQYTFEIAVGPEYNLTHVPCCTARDIDLSQAIADLTKLRIRKERQAFRDQDNT